MNFETIAKLLSAFEKEELAKLFAYVAAPLIILLITFSRYYAPGLAVDPEKPVAIAQLKTELGASGSVVARPGIALIIDPVEAEYRIRVRNSPERLWTSLNEDDLQTNKDRLLLKNGTVYGKAPFFGVSDPVTIIAEGEMDKSIRLPGNREDPDDWRLVSRRSSSLFSGVLVACIFSFGVAFSMALPIGSKDQNVTRKLRA